MKIEGVPEGWELVRIGKPEKGEVYVFHPDQLATANFDHECDCYAIVRRIEEPSPGDGWRWVGSRETIEHGDELRVAGKWIQSDWVGLTAMREHEYRRRIGPRLRKVGERLQRGDEFMNARGFWQPISPDMIGMEVVGGRYYAEK